MLVNEPRPTQPPLAAVLRGSARAYRGTLAALFALALVVRLVTLAVVGPKLGIDSQSYLLQGAEILIYCTCESGLAAEHKLSAYRALPVARAAENEIYVLMANSPANPDNIRSTECSHGNSKIIDPLGNVLIEAGYFEERAMVADIDLALATRRVATRVLNDATVLQEWYRQGVQYVDVMTQEEPSEVVELTSRKPR